MSPYKSDSIAINNEKLDRRRKISNKQREQIKHLASEGVPIRQITKLFGVSRRTIQFILFPERKLKQDWRKYYDKVKRREYMKRHRAYKNKLYKEGLIHPLTKKD